MSKKRVLIILDTLLLIAALVLGFLSVSPMLHTNVVVEWSTASELDTAGFNLYRKDSPDGLAIQVNTALIQAIGNGPTGGVYSFTDTGVTNGVTFYDGLIATSTSNESQTFSPVGPVVPGGTTATATQTSVVTRTPTATGSSNSQTSTPARTPTLIRTPTVTQIGAYPGPVPSPYQGPTQSPNPTQPLTPNPGSVTSVPTRAELTPGINATPANNLTQLDGPTATLRPFPSVTIEFPDATQTPVVAKQSTPSPGDNNGLLGWVGLVRLGPLALVLLIWVLLGGWFYLTLRRME